MKETKIILHESEDGILYFDAKKGRFCFVTEGSNDPLLMARTGFFDLTHEQYDAIGTWIKGLLNNGVLQN